LLLALRRQQSSAPTGPVFLTPRRGLASLAATLAERVTGAGAVISAPTTVREIASDGSRWRVDGQGFDAVIVTAPAAAASSLLTSICSDAAMVLGGIPQAGVVMVGLHVARPVGPPASGYLVPKPVQRHVTAVSLASSKWAHWQPPAGGAVLRVSLGRYGNQAPMDLDDAAVVQTAVDEVGRHLGGALDVVAHRVTRWPGAFPQYLPHHSDRVAAAEAALVRDAPGVVIAGASVRGVGVPACIRQGREAAQAVVSHLDVARH
jgi:oxygen-dependent protoporphyrinogen oxidase